MILFMPDQLRYDAVGAFGNEVRLSASTCSQSRCSMFTGQYPHVSGHRTLENLLKPWEPNVFRSLREGGYHVAYLAPRGDFYAENATELGVNEYGFLTDQTLPDFARESFDLEDKNSLWNRLFYLGERNASTAVDYDEVLTRGALQWLESPPEEPWVLFLPLIFPHLPFTVEEPWFSLHDRSNMPVPPGPEERTGYTPRFYETLREQYGLQRANASVWQEVMGTYYGMVSRVDDQFGRVMNKTKDQGLWNQTVTLFYTDHGEFLGDSHMIEKWPSGVSENLVHEPMIIGGAGLPENVVYEEMAEMIDLVPTLLQLGTVNETYYHYGKSLVDAMHAAGRGEVLPHRDMAYTEGGFLLSDEPLLEQSPFPYDIKASLQHNDTALVGKALGMRSKEWTYVYRLYEPDELYSRLNDTQELHNLAGEPEYAHIRAMMHEKALRWLVETPMTIPWYLDERKPDVDLESPYEQYQQRCHNCTFDQSWPGPGLPMVDGVAAMAGATGSTYLEAMTKRVK
ncbi:hypothetical protein KC354_g2616 [Hortaea werneckii]|nr:hypothetical protein KC354_g2616 [Hortaea werneckii]